MRLLLTPAHIEKDEMEKASILLPFVLIILLQKKNPWCCVVLLGSLLKVAKVNLEQEPRKPTNSNSLIKLLIFNMSCCTTTIAAATTTRKRKQHKQADNFAARRREKKEPSPPLLPHTSPLPLQEPPLRREKKTFFSSPKRKENPRRKLLYFLPFNAEHHTSCFPFFSLFRFFAGGLQYLWTQEREREKICWDNITYCCIETKCMPLSFLFRCGPKST